MRFAIVGKCDGIPVLPGIVQLHLWQTIYGAAIDSYIVHSVFVLVGYGAVAPISGEAWGKAQLFSFLPDTQE